MRCWGQNNQGAVGDGTTVDRAIPIDVAGLSSGVIAISAGAGHTCALTTGGGVKCWGNNNSGQLGDGTQVDRAIPVDVAGLTSGVTAIAAGDSHTCALTTGGAAKCWGGGAYGSLGDGSRTSQFTPVDVMGLSGGVAAIKAGGNHTCALMGAGGMKCWGNNWMGQLGDGTEVNRWTPVDVTVLASGVTAIDVGMFHTCVLTTAGGVKCWGYNGSGQLGDGTIAGRREPADVVSLTSGVAAISIAGFQSCALTTGGGAKCWGNNSRGQVGDGSVADRRVPADVATLASGVAAVEGGGDHSCALTTLGGVKCWGSNYRGWIGDGTLNDRLVPVDVYGMNDADNDGIPDGVETAEGRNPLAKDNYVFADARLFAMQQYRDFLWREGEPAGIAGWSSALGSGLVYRERVVDAFVMSQEFSEAVAPVVRLYFACFQRPPDYDGLVFNARLLRDGARSREQMASYFASGPEFVATYGSLDNAQFVTRLYQNVLGRAPDPAGLSGWVAILAAGAPRGRVVLGFSDSPEFHDLIANEVFATMMYVGMLKRSPDPAGFAIWVSYLDSGPYLHEYMINAILLSAEYRARFLP